MPNPSNTNTGSSPASDGPWSFSVAPGINQYWVEVSVQAPTGSAITKVEAIVGNRQWVTLPMTNWGTYAKSFEVAVGASVVFRVWDQAGLSHDSQKFIWPGSAPSTQPSAGDWNFSISPNINENWVEVSVSGPSGSGVTKVEAIIDNNHWETLPKTNWETYGKSFYVARGSSVVFRVWDQAGTSHDSGSTRWLD